MATAAGCQLVASGDLAAAGEGARFQTPGVHIGLFCRPPRGRCRDLGRKHALEMLLTGDMVSAERAAEIGLVNRVVPAAGLTAATTEYAERIAAKSPLTLKIGKELFDASSTRRSPMPTAWPRRRWSRTCSRAMRRRGSAPSWKSANPIGQGVRVASPRLVATAKELAGPAGRRLPDGEEPSVSRRQDGVISTRAASSLDRFRRGCDGHDRVREIPAVTFVITWLGGGLCLVLRGGRQTCQLRRRLTKVSSSSRHGEGVHPGGARRLGLRPDHGVVAGALQLALGDIGLVVRARLRPRLASSRRVPTRSAR